MLTVKTEKQTKLMDRLLSLLAAILLIGGIWYGAINHRGHVGSNAGDFAPIGDSIDPGNSEGSEGSSHRLLPVTKGSEQSRSAVNQKNDRNAKTAQGNAKDVSRLNRPPDYRLEVTAYSWTGRPTKSGAWPEVGCVAVDPKVIPLGTELWVEGYGYAIALDTGADIKGNRLDLFMETRDQALEYGRKYNVRVWILKN